MSVLPRAMVLAAVLMVAMSPPALAEGSDGCVGWKLVDGVEGLRIIAETGTQLAFGFMADTPIGDGIGYVVFITPSLCAGGGGLPLGEIGEQGVQGLLEDLPGDLPEVLPLP